MSVLAPPPPASGVMAHGLQAGTRAPELDIPSSPDGQRERLAGSTRSPVVLVFYPGDFTPVCTSELGLFTELMPAFNQFGARVLGISCDSLWSHIAFAKELHLEMPLLSDFHLKGEVSKRYDVYREDAGISERALFVIDGDGVIYWSFVSPIEVNPGADGVIDALERLTGRPMEFPGLQPTPAAPEARS